MPTEKTLAASPGCMRIGVRDLGLALALALLAGLFGARTLAYPWLEVSDPFGAARVAADEAPKSLAASWRAGGIGTVALFIESSSGSALVSRSVNLLLHASGVALFFLLLRRCALPLGAALFAACLCAVAPPELEALAWLAQRSSLLGAWFLLLGACASGTSVARRASAGVCFALALAAAPELALGVLGFAWLARAHTAPARPWSLAGARLELVVLAAAGLLLLTLRGPGAAQGAPAPEPWELFGAAAACALGFALAPRLARRLPWIAAGGIAYALLSLPGLLAAACGAPWALSSLAAAALGLGLTLAVALLGGSSNVSRLVAVSIVVSLATRGWTRLADWRGEPELQRAALAHGGERARLRANDALGAWHVFHGRLSAAQGEFESALARSPGDPLVELHLGELEIRRALIPGQEEHLRRAEEHLLKCPDLPRALEGLGEVHQRGGDARGAEPYLARAVELDPYAARAQLRLGMARFALQDYPGARAAYDQACALDPRAADAWCGRALVRYEQHDLAGAEEDVARALALEPDHPDARTARARLELARGDTQAAERDFARAVAVNPDNFDALFELAQLLAPTRAEQALRCYDRVCDERPRPPHVRAHNASARLHMAAGTAEEDARARARVEALLEFNPEQTEARALLKELDARAAQR